MAGRINMNFEKMIQELLEAIKLKDLQQVLSLISVDEEVCQILLNGTSINGRAAFINLQTAWFADPDWQLEYKILRTIETAAMAYALLLVHYSDATLRDEPYDKQHYLSLVFTRKDDMWSLVHDQTTIVV
jgi:ketosteroid isomerase-like protein